MRKKNNSSDCNSNICACIYWWYCKTVKGISRRHYPIPCLNRSLRSQEVHPPRSSRKFAQKGGKVDSLRQRPHLSPRHTPGTRLYQKLSGLQEYSVARKTESMKNPNDPIGKQNRDIPAWSAVPQPTASMGILKPVHLLNCLCGENSWNEVNTIQLTDGEIKRRKGQRSALQHHNNT